MKKIKNFSQQKPLLFVLAVCVIYCLFLNIPSPRFAVFPDNMVREYLKELYGILWPVALSLLFGFRFIYHRKGFGSTELHPICSQQSIFAVEIFGFSC